MRVILQVVSGPDRGRKALLRPGQELRVGRTEWAEFSVSSDPHMSGVHFAVQTDDRACYVSDLGSSNGTFVNGQPIGEKTAVADGDDILAGETHFGVVTEREPGDPRVVTAPLPAGRDAPAAPAGQSEVPAKIVYTVETCSSGLTLCRGSTAEIAPQDLAVRLAHLVPAFLIADFNNLAGAPPEELKSPEYLFDWLAPEIASAASPVLVCQEDLPTWPAILEVGWGSDAVLCLFSRQQRGALLEHLRRCLRAKPKREAPAGGILGYCWPSVMSSLLAHNTPQLVSRLLENIDAALVELPDLPETWQLYGTDSITAMLDQIGLVRQSPDEADSPEEAGSPATEPNGSPPEASGAT